MSAFNSGYSLSPTSVKPTTATNALVCIISLMHSSPYVSYVILAIQITMIAPLHKYINSGEIAVIILNASVLTVRTAAYVRLILAFKHKKPVFEEK